MGRPIVRERAAGASVSVAALERELFRHLVAVANHARRAMEPVRWAPGRHASRPRMSFRVPVLCLVFAALLFTCPGAHAGVTGKADDIAQLRERADRWDKAIVAKRRDDIEANMAEDFRQIDGSGNIEDKRSFVEGLLDSALTIHPYTVEDFDVRLYGDVALLSGRTRMTGTYAAKPFTSHYRYIDIYVRRGGEWRIVSVQITKLAS